MLSRSLFVVLGVAVILSTLTGILNGAAPQPDARQIAAESLQLNLTPILTSGLTQPLILTPAGDSRLFIVERAGVIRIYQGGPLLSQPFLDISGLDRDTGFEEGLLGLAFPPTFSPSHAQFVNNAGDLVSVCYNVSSANHANPDPKPNSNSAAEEHQDAPSVRIFAWHHPKVAIFPTVSFQFFVLLTSSICGSMTFPL